MLKLSVIIIAWSLLLCCWCCSDLRVLWIFASCEWNDGVTNSFAWKQPYLMPSYTSLSSLLLLVFYSLQTYFFQQECEMYWMWYEVKVISSLFFVFWSIKSMRVLKSQGPMSVKLHLLHFAFIYSSCSPLRSVNFSYLSYFLWI